MSVIVDATYAGETFEVEIFHDGHIEFPDRDLRHEQAMAEFTDSESAVLRFYNLWEESPTKVIFGNLELPENSIPRLAADCAERVLPICEREDQSDRRPRDAIEATRKFVAGEIDRPTIDEAMDAAWAASAQAATSAASWAAGAADAAATAAGATKWAAKSWAASSAAQAAAQAAAWNASSDVDSAEWQQARAVETAWQVRRFVDVMEAIGQGFDWPDIKVTP